MNSPAKITILIFLTVVSVAGCKKEMQIPLQQQPDPPLKKEINLYVGRWNADTTTKYFFTTLYLPHGYSVHNLLSVYKEYQGHPWIPLDSIKSQAYYKIENDKVIIYSHCNWCLFGRSSPQANAVLSIILYVENILFNRVKFVFR